MHFPSAQPREAVMGHQVFKELGDFAVPTLGIRAGPSTGDGTAGHLETFCGEELSQEQVLYIKLMLLKLSDVVMYLADSPSKG